MTVQSKSSYNFPVCCEDRLDHIIYMEHLFLYKECNWLMVATDIIPSIPGFHIGFIFLGGGGNVCVRES